MSTWVHREVPCPGCGATNRTPILKGIHITRLPAVREDIVAGRFQRTTCPHCGFQAQIESTTVYTDFDNGQYIAVEPPAPKDWRAALAPHQAVFDRCFTMGPPIAEELGRGIRHRLVFGVDALREKVLLWDAGLDDRVLESCKGDWLASEGKGPRDEELRLTGVLPGGHCVLRRLSPRRELLGHTTLLADDYQRRLSGTGSQYPQLMGDWVVDLYVTS